jgi:hypothetical protein
MLLPKTLIYRLKFKIEKKYRKFVSKTKRQNQNKLQYIIGHANKAHVKSFFLKKKYSFIQYF